MTRRRPFYADTAVTIHHGNALDLPLPDASVDLIVTSPPYFGLRSYQDDGEHYDGQIGDEATPAEFVDALIAATREMVRVLKPGGSIWVNLGDKYASNGGHRSQGHNTVRAGRRSLDAIDRPETNTTGIPNKSLLGTPWRYALRCVDDLGLILRAEVIWWKPNGLPESVTDRVRRSHEQWFHFTKSGQYFSAVDMLREPHEMRPQRRPGGRPTDLTPRNGQPRQSWSTAARDEVGVDGHPLGKLPGSVWNLPTQPLAVPEAYGVEAGRIVAYFPTDEQARAWQRHGSAPAPQRPPARRPLRRVPLEWPRRLILGWSPSGICTACGEGRQPVTVAEQVPYRAAAPTGRPKQQDPTGTRPANGWNGAGYPQTVAHRTLVGETCGCPEPTAPTRPAVVLDPFGGTGTVGVAARALGRHAHLVDLSADYCRLARWRVNDPAQLERAAPGAAGRAATSTVRTVTAHTPIGLDLLDLLTEEPA